MTTKHLKDELQVIEIERKAALEKETNEKQKKFIAGQLAMIGKVKKLLSMP